MKKAMIDRQRTIVAYGQSAEVAQPGEGAFDNPSPLVTTQCATILRGWFAPTLAVRDDRFDTAATQLFAQPIAIVAAIHDHALGFLSRPPRPMLPPYADRRERFLDERDFRGGCRVKVVSQRNTLAVDHHHPLRPLTPPWFFPTAQPLFRRSKTAVHERFAPLQLLPTPQSPPAGRRRRKLPGQITPASLAAQNPQNAI